MPQKSLIASAFDVLTASNKSLPFKTLFDKSVKESNIIVDPSELKSKMASFYTQLTVDGRFALLDNGTWDLCSRHKFDTVHPKIEDDYDEDIDEDDEEEKELLKAELGEEDDSDDGDSDDIDYDKPKKEADEDVY